MARNQGSKAVLALILWGFIGGTGYAMWSFSKEQDASKLSAMLAAPEDDAELMMAKYGMPEVDENTDHKQGAAAALVMKHFTYKTAGVEVAFVCEGGQKPCGRRWKLVAFADVTSKNLLKVDEALARLRPLLRKDGPSKELDTRAASVAPDMAKAAATVAATELKNAIKEKDAEIAKFKRGGLIYQVEFREHAAEMQVYPSTFVGLPMNAKRGLCNLVFQRARLSNNYSLLVVRVTDYRTEKEFGTCSDDMPFEMAD